MFTFCIGRIAHQGVADRHGLPAGLRATHHTRSREECVVVRAARAGGPPGGGIPAQCTYLIHYKEEFEFIVVVHDLERLSERQEFLLAGLADRFLSASSR